MSDATLVVRQYETASELSEGLARALIDVKRVQLCLPGADSVSIIQLDASRRNLVTFVEAIGLALGLWPEERVNETAQQLRVPEALVEWMRLAHRGEAVTAPRLEVVLAHIGALPTVLAHSDFLLLERLLGVVDTYATHLMRRVPFTSGKN